MLKLFLDEDLSPKIADEVSRHRPEIAIHSLLRWRDRILVSEPDDVVLSTLAPEGLTLVTYDLATIPATLQEFTEEGRDFAGVVFVDDRTIPQKQVGTLVKALIAFHDIHKDEDWLNRSAFIMASG